MTTLLWMLTDASLLAAALGRWRLWRLLLAVQLVLALWAELS